MRRPTRIDRYIIGQLLVALVAVTGGLVALIWLTQSLRFVEMVVNRGLSLLVFLELTGLLVPSFIAVILPITTFVVVQFIYQRLAGDRELTVMRGAGLSNLALARPALVVAVLAMALGFALNIWLVPASFTAFRQYQFEIRNRLAAFLLQEGVFTDISDKLTVYVRTRELDGTLRGILVNDQRDPNAQSTILAESGRLIAGNGPPRVLLENGSREEIDRRTGRLNVLTFSRNTIDLAESGPQDEHRTRDNTEMSLHELLHPPAGTPKQDQARDLVEAMRRLSAPITTLGYAMVALVPVLCGSFRRYGNMLRQFVAILVMVGLLAAGLVVANMAARTPALVPLMWVHAVLPALVCAAILFAPPRLGRPFHLPARA